MKRENGFYWIKLAPIEYFDDEGDLQIAQYNNSVWWIAGTELIFYDKDFAIIYEEKLKEPDINPTHFIIVYKYNKNLKMSYTSPIEIKWLSMFINVLKEYYNYLYIFKIKLHDQKRNNDNY